MFELPVEFPPDVDELDEPPIEFCSVTVHGALLTLIQIDFEGKIPDDRTR